MVDSTFPLSHQALPYTCLSGTFEKEDQPASDSYLNNHIHYWIPEKCKKNSEQSGIRTHADYSTST